MLCRCAALPLAILSPSRFHARQDGGHEKMRMRGRKGARWHARVSRECLMHVIPPSSYLIPCFSFAHSFSFLFFTHSPFLPPYSVAHLLTHSIPLHPSIAHSLTAFLPSRPRTDTCKTCDSMKTKLDSETNPDTVLHSRTMGTSQMKS